MKIETLSKVPRIAEFECLSRIYNPGDPAENAVCRKYATIIHKSAELICMKPKMNNQNICFGDSGGKFQSYCNILISNILCLIER